MTPNTISHTSIITIQPRFLWFLTLSYAMVIAISNWFDSRLIEIFNLVISPGSLSFPLTFLLSDTITEVYGYKHARRAIWAAFFFNILFLFYGQLITHLPSPSFATENASFDKILRMNTWVVIGSFASYLISEPINSYILAKLKVLSKGQYLGIRFVVSTIAAAFIDSVFFITIAFHSSFSIPDLIQLMLDIWLVKTFVEIVGLPFSIRLSKWLKKQERLDVYDYDTNFNPFSLDVQYSTQNNLYKEEKNNA